jgi:lipopolysaccharide/colanic/teichoic acid biosynthesis glycosyltransferase
MSLTFPYKKPNKKLLMKFKHLEKLDKINILFCKLFFDKFLSLIIILFLASPLLLFLYIIFTCESFFSKDSRGPFLYYYNSVSQGRYFRKYKIRFFKMKFLDSRFQQDDWRAYSKISSNRKHCTFFGFVIKKYYLDEIPQIFSVLAGEISLIGPRPLSVFHYKKDFNQGNFIRQKLIGGLIGPGHLNKGLVTMGTPELEFMYADMIYKGNCLRVLFFDLKIIYKTFLLISKGGGH